MSSSDVTRPQPADRSGPPSGDAGLANEIKKLRRPSVSALLVNQLPRKDSDQIDELLTLGEAVRVGVFHVPPTWDGNQ